MRKALLGLVLAVAACSESYEPNVIPDSEFSEWTNQELVCFETVAEALAPLIARTKADLRGESGVSEVRVTRRDERTFVIDSQQWDSGHDDRGYFQQRQILQRTDSDDSEWCQTRVLGRAVGYVSY
jgi:hypothetical protein